MNKILIGIIALLIVGGGIALLKTSSSTYTQEQKEEEKKEEVIPVESDGGIGDGAEPLDELLEAQKDNSKTILGSSVNNADIVARHFGDGEREVVFVGGIHGGYAWSTALVAYELIEYLENNEESIPENVRVTVIPVLNPDGLKSVTDADGVFSKSDVSGTEKDLVAARFNANDVDLNRNFDCNWKEEGVWKSQAVSGGSAPFSEPESEAFQSYILKSEPTAVVAWYAAAGGVYSSSCGKGVSKDTAALTNVYAAASGYAAYDEFDSYEVNGDMVNWLASKRIPAISVLLTTKTASEWSKNEAGVKAVLNHIAK